LDKGFFLGQFLVPGAEPEMRVCDEVGGCHGLSVFLNN
jgi:hypothetical protein